MKAAALRVFSLLALASLVVVGCAGGATAEEHDAVLAELTAAESRAAAAEAETDGLRSDVGSLTAERDRAMAELTALQSTCGEVMCGESAQDAWDATWARHERIREDVPERGLLLELA
ncbi:MAG: hypothetical protein KAQ74_06110, partial [Dehalococcoidia bacterium]|nr:hypothetical protein [Dehalococcoidia bacterium]